MSALQENSEPLGNFETEQAMLWSDTMDLFYGPDTTAHAVWSDGGMFAVVAGTRSDTPDSNYYHVASVIEEDRLTLITQVQVGVPIKFRMVEGRVLFNNNDYSDQEQYQFCQIMRRLLGGTAFTASASIAAVSTFEAYYADNYLAYMNSNTIYQQYPGLLAWLDQLQSEESKTEPS